MQDLTFILCLVLLMGAQVHLKSLDLNFRLLGQLRVWAVFYLAPNSFSWHSWGQSPVAMASLFARGKGGQISSCLLLALS